MYVNLHSNKLTPLVLLLVLRLTDALFFDFPPESSNCALRFDPSNLEAPLLTKENIDTAILRILKDA